MAEEANGRRVASPMDRHHNPKGCERDRDTETDKDHNKENWARGPRSLYLKRSENGFGFTLRHFIVYPPESYTVLSRDRRLGLRGGEWDEPMDTIFVKHVRPNSPASIAGLATGDRIVSVNGETICGKSYALVVQLIHQSPLYLHLLVVPKEDDLLQLYFGETAHNPETNPRPRLRSPEMVSGVGELRPHGQNASPNSHHSRLSSHQQQQLQIQHSIPPASYHNVWDDVRFHSPQRIPTNNINAGPRRASEGSKTSFLLQPSVSGTTNVGLPPDRYGSSESMSNYMSPNAPGCRLSLDAGIISQRDSNSRDSSASSLDSASRDIHSSDDSLIINRIRKSFEQKEEFLKRPTGPILVGGGPELIPPKEFYARPQKLQPPIWPPAIPASPHHSPARKSISNNDELIVERGGFVCGGPVTNVPNQDLTRGSRIRSSGGFVTTLDRIQENGKIVEPTGIAVAPLSRLAIVSQRARQFESGRVDDGELPDRTSLYKSELARLTEKRSNPNVAVRKKEFEAKSERKGFSSRESRSLDSAVAPYAGPKHTSTPISNQILSGSTVTIPTSPPPSASLPSTSSSSPTASDSRSSSSITITTPTSTACVLSGNRTIPVGNHKLHCVPPTEDDSRDKGSDKISASFDVPSPGNDKETEQTRPRSNSAESAWLGNAWPNRHKAVRQDSYLQACRKPIRTVSVLQDECRDSITPLTSPNLVASRSIQNNIVSGTEDDRNARRVSYLKATWNDRMAVDSEPDVSDSETQHRTQQSVPVSRTSLCVSDLGDKENHQVFKEGSLHCKLTLVDGKRASDRSWKQVWAVLKGPILYLYKERRDSLPFSETPLGADSFSGASSGSSGSCEQVDVRCAVVAPADNYTKRKHVLRLTTLSNSELLLQAEDADQMARWIFALQEQANNNNTGDNLTSSSLSPIPTHKGIKKLTSFRNRSPTGQSPVNKTRKPSQSVDQQQPQQLPSPKTKTWKGRVAKQFKKIGQGAGSPVSPTAPDSNAMHPVVYPEGATIGIPLEDCPMSTVSECVPLLVELCTGIVEARGLEIIGIYRVPGNTAAVSSLTEAVNRGLDASVLEQDPRWTDVNVISSLLKSFFRRLPDSLLTSDLYPLFIEADKIDDPVLRIATIRKLVHDLPDHHYETLRYLMQHLKRVVDHCSVNKMEARNLAIVFGPTLIRTGDDNMVTMVTDMSHQCRIVETLILYVDWCFSDDDVDQLKLNITSDLVEGRPGSQSDGDALLNHNLLLGNIHKVEGMKYDCTQKEITAKDIVSSIICAANRKMQKAKSRKATSSTSGLPHLTSGNEDSVDSNVDGKQVSSVLMRHRLDTKTKALNRKERVTSASDDIVNEHPRGISPNVASSIRQSILFSGNIANKLPIDNESGEDVKQLSSNKESNVIDEEGTIKTYTGLSTATQERIRRFEMETKAMLHRDSSRSRAGSSSIEENRDWEKQRIDREWQQAKRELEIDDILDRFADNPSAIGNKIVDQGESNRRDSTVECLPHQSKRDINMEDITNTKLTSVDGSVQPSSNLKRFKTGRELKNDLSFNVSGSLDSLQGSSGSDQPNSQASDDGGDLLLSLTSTFDAKMRSLLSSNSTSEDTTTQSDNATVSPPITPPTTSTKTSNISTAFRDPSLHRASSVEKGSDSTHQKDSKKENISDEEKSKQNENKSENTQSSYPSCETDDGCGEKADDLNNTDPTSNKENIIDEIKTPLTKIKKNGDDEFNIEKANLRRSESLNRRDDKRESSDACKLRRSESLNKGESGSYATSKLKRSESLNKSETKLKRSDSLTKTEKTESNLNKRRQLEAGRWSNVTKLKRKNGVLSERSIKRRHTVGGTKDFDKVNWLDNRQREAECEISRKERRTSSPDLSSSRLAGILVEVVLRPHSIADSNVNSRLFNVPLESHV